MRENSKTPISGLLLGIFLSFLFLTAGCSRIKPGETTGLTGAEHLKLGAVYESHGKLDLALEEYRKAGTQYHTRADAYFAIGNVYLKMERLRDAEASYLKAIGGGFSKGIYHNNLAWVYLETGELEKAEKEIDKAMRTGSSEQHIYLDTLGVLQTRLGNFVEAEATLTKSAEMTPRRNKGELKQIYEHLYELYIRVGETEKADLMREKIRGLD